MPPINTFADTFCEPHFWHRIEVPNEHRIEVSNEHRIEVPNERRIEVSNEHRIEVPNEHRIEVSNKHRIEWAAFNVVSQRRKISVKVSRAKAPN